MVTKLNSFSVMAATSNCRYQEIFSERQIFKTLANTQACYQKTTIS